MRKLQCKAVLFALCLALPPIAQQSTLLAQAKSTSSETTSGQATMTNAVVIRMAKAGLSEDVIIGAINSHPGAYRTDPDDLIALKSAGVSNRVIEAMTAKSVPVPSVPPKASNDAESITLEPPKGLVEAEIGSGELMLARYAKVLVVPTDLAGPIVNNIDTIRSVIDDTRRKAGNDPERQMVEIQCLMALVKIRLALTTAGIQAGKNPDNSKSAVLIDADDAGRFTLTGVTFDPFVVVAIGKVGMNAAIWVSESTPLSQHQLIKLDHPAVACYDAQATF